MKLTLEKPKRLKNIIAGILVMLAVILLDQITKIVVVNSFVTQQLKAVELIKDFFYISYVRNDGAAWSLFAGNQVVLVWLSGIALVLTLILIFYTDRMSVTVPLAMVAGGGFGNLINRMFEGSVVDFFDMYIFGYDFPVFNVADISLTCGTILLCMYILFLYKEDNTGFIFKIRTKDKVPKDESNKDEPTNNEMTKDE